MSLKILLKKVIINKEKLMKKHINVAAAVFIKNGRLFSAQRANRGVTAKKWEFPGGKVEKDEESSTTIVRAIKEEMDTDISVIKPLITVNHEYPTFNITMTAFLCKIDKGALTLSEHLDSKWLKANEIMTIDWAEADIPIAKYIQESWDDLCKNN